MMNALMIGGNSGGAGASGRSLSARTEVSASDLRVQIKKIPSAAMDELTLSALDIDGQSYLGDVVDAVSPQLVSEPAPGRISGSGKVVTALTQPLEVGALYVVSYDIIADGGTTGLFFPAGNGSPFPNSTQAPFSLGRHKVLVEAQDSDTAALLRLNGDLTFGFVSCRKAQWRLDLPEGTAHPEMVLNREPGRLKGTGVVVSSLTAPLETGESYTLRYEIRGASPDARVFTPAGAGSPFFFNQLPTTIGHHSVTLIAQDGDTEAVARVNGDVSFGYFSCRKAGGGAGRQIRMNVAAGSTRSRDVFYTPDPGTLYVAPWGDDGGGTGAFGSPFATPSAACSAARPGDTVYLRPGVYPPFEVSVSGTASQPITITTLPEEARQAVIEGDLMQHVVYGGAGVEPAQSTRDGIYINSQDHIHIRDLTIRNTWRGGIFIVGTEGEQHGHHVLAGNAIMRTGSSGIYVGGNSSATIIPLTETGLSRTDDVLIEYNDVSQTNVVTDYNNNSTNPQGVPGGVSEAITVAAGVSNVITRFNDVHDTRQYGIDYKAGVRGGEIHGNRVWNVERYGIYLDAGRRFVEDVKIYNNHVWACRIGIVLAREAGSNTVEYQTFRAQEGAEEFVQTLADIDVYNNAVWDTEAAGIFCQRHAQKDGPDGAIRDVRIRFNTVYNANRIETGRDLNLSGWSEPDFEAADIVSGFEFIGNILWNDTADVAVLDTFSGKPGFAIESNLIGVDPGFANPAASPPDLSLTPGSAAALLVGADFVEGGFALDIKGASRSTARSAGAYAIPVS